MGGGSSKTKKMTAGGQDAEAVPPSGASPGAAQEKVPAVSSDKDGSATSAFESVPAGDAEGRGTGASKEERGPSDKPRGEGSEPATGTLLPLHKSPQHGQHGQQHEQTQPTETAATETKQKNAAAYIGKIKD